MRQTTILTLLIAAAMSVALFFLKYQVTGLEDQLESLNKGIDANHETMHVLQAEWSHLNDIDRLRGLSKRYLNLAPTSPTHIVTPEELPATADATPAPLAGGRAR